MTHKEWKELTPEQKRIKVAELDGYSSISEPTDEWVARYEENIGHLPNNTLVGKRNNQGLDLVPDYLNDLNAMHEMEADKFLNNDKINDELRFAYGIILHKLNMQYGLNISVWETLYASSEQRAEAMVLTFSSTLVKKDDVNFVLAMEGDL